MAADGSGLAPRALRREVRERFGVVSNFFCSAAASPGPIEDLWQFAKAAYLDAPLPPLFKERLFVQLSRFCRVRYCIIRHTGFLLGRGRPAGDEHAAPETVDHVLALLRRRIPDAAALAPAVERLERLAAVIPLPAPRSELENDLFDALTFLFLCPAAADRARTAVRHAVGDATFDRLIAYLAFIRTAHYWTELHPELAYEEDLADMLQSDEELAARLLDLADAELITQELVCANVIGEAVRAEAAARVSERVQAEADLRESERRRQLALDAAALGTFVWYPQDDRGEPDARMLELFGLAADSTLNLAEALATTLHPDDCGPYAAAVARAVDPNQDGRLDAEIRVIHPDQSLHWVAVTAQVTFDEGTPSRAARMYGIAADVTARKEAEQRQAFLLAVSDALRPLTDAAVLQQTAMRLLGEQLGVVRASCFEVEADQETVTLTARHERNAAPIPERMRLTDFAADMADACRAGQTLIVRDTESDASLAAQRAAYRAIGIRAWAAVPLVKGGRLIAIVGVQSEAPRDWADAELRLLEEVAERTWAAVERARAEEALQRAHDSLEQRVRERTEQVQSLFERLVSTQEEERRRLAQDVHDQLGQQTTALRMSLELLASQVAHQEAAAPQAARSQRLAEELDRRVDLLTWDLRPAALDHLGLAAALDKLMTGWSARFHIGTELDTGGTASLRLARDKEASIYRLAQDALHNVVAHAHATRVSMSLQRRGSDLLLVVEDNGRGFALDGTPPESGRGGLGLAGMKERAALIGGAVHVESAPGRGTTIFVRVPIAAATPGEA